MFRQTRPNLKIAKQSDRLCNQNGMVQGPGISRMRCESTLSTTLSARSLPGVYPEYTLSLWHRQLDAPMLGGPSDPSDQGLRQCTKRANRSQPMATKLHATGPAAATAATGAATCCRISGHRNVRNTSRIGVKTSKVFILERFQDITLNKVSLHPYRLR